MKVGNTRTICFVENSFTLLLLSQLIHYRIQNVAGGQAVSTIIFFTLSTIEDTPKLCINCFFKRYINSNHSNILLLLRKQVFELNYTSLEHGTDLNSLEF